MIDFFKSLFKPAPPSGATAKERLRLVLLSDHLSLAPDVVESLKRDLLEVISRYVEIDPRLADVSFEQRETEVAMLANIPITGVRERERPVAATYAAVEATPPMPAPVPKPAPVEPVAARTEDELEPLGSLEPEGAENVDEQGEPVGSIREMLAEPAVAEQMKLEAAVVPAPTVLPANAGPKPAKRRRRRKKAAAQAPVSGAKPVQTWAATSS